MTSKPKRKLDADLLTPSEIERLLRVCSNRAPTGIRNRALLAVAWRSGLRIGEVLALRPKDIDLDAGALVVQHGKNDRRRIGGVDAGTGALVARWNEPEVAEESVRGLVNCRHRSVSDCYHCSNIPYNGRDNNYF